LRAWPLLSRILLLFWGVWFAVVTASNLADGLQQLGWLALDFPFVSGNYALVVEAIAVFGLGTLWAALLFAGVIALEALSALLFLRAALGPGRSAEAEILPFVPAAALVAAFLVCDEAFVVYERMPHLETNHLLMLCALLLSLGVVSSADA